VLTGVATVFSWVVTPAAPPEPDLPATPPAAAAPVIPPASPSPAQHAETAPGAAAAQQAARRSTAAAVFDRACATCHTVERLRAALRSSTDRNATRDAWLTLLGGHGDTSDAEDRELIDFLVSAANQP
jgi:mono/diheme cytochrome c family protein